MAGDGTARDESAAGAPWSGIGDEEASRSVTGRQGDSARRVRTRGEEVRGSDRSAGAQENWQESGRGAHGDARGWLGFGEERAGHGSRPAPAFQLSAPSLTVCYKIYRILPLAPEISTVLFPINLSTATSTNESMPLSGSINEGQLGNLKAAEA